MVISQNEVVTGRFAPSPTGPLHMGSLIAAVGSYLFAKSARGLWLMRMEDIDAPRVVRGCDADILRTLEALGLFWDGDVVYQSKRTALYQEALENLAEKGLVYPCGCTRKELAAAPSAPHDGDEGPAYPGSCRKGLPVGKTPRSMRLLTEGRHVHFVDGLRGAIDFSFDESGGDFVLKRADGLFAYQLAVVADDAAMGVNQVVRGADLLFSTPRQILLQRLLGLPTPAYAHLPLVTAEGGGKLSKRDNAVSFAAGIDLEKEGGGLIGLALSFLGHPPPSELSGALAHELIGWAAANFNPEKVPSTNRQIR